MGDLDKVKHLLSHYVEHLEEHAREFIGLAEKAEKEEGGEALARAIREASQKMEEVISILSPFLKG